jgi:hypothetical protein
VVRVKYSPTATQVAEEAQATARVVSLSARPCLGRGAAVAVQLVPDPVSRIPSAELLVKKVPTTEQTVVEAQATPVRSSTLTPPLGRGASVGVKTLPAPESIKPCALPEMESL